jgi:hypothetical protein
LDGYVLAKRDWGDIVFDGHVAEQVLVLLFTSVTVRITVLPLTFAQLNVVIFNAND